MKNMMKATAVLLLALLVCNTAISGNTTPVSGTAKSQDGTEIRYEVMGSGEPSLLFVHCWCCDSTYWREQIPVFSQKYRVIAVDLAGHGKSALTRQNYTIENYARDVEAVASQLNLKNVILLGHSMGGPVSVFAAALMPERVIAVVGVDTLGNVEEKPTKEQAEGFLTMFRADFKKSTENFIRSMMFYPDANSELVNWIATDMASAPPEVGIQSMASIFQTDVAAAMDKLTVPVFLINADKFPVSEEVGKRHAKSFNVRIIPKVGHFLQLENPAAFNNALEETIQEIMKDKK